MLDTGSQKTFITRALADRLGAERVGKDKFYLQSAGYANSKKCSGDVVEITLKSRFSNNSLKIRATSLPDVIKGTLPSLNYKGKLKPIADNNDEDWSTQVEILIGVDFFTNIVGSIMKKSNGLIAFETIFGDFLCGVPQGEDVQFEQSVTAAIWENRRNWSANKIPKTVSLLAAVAKEYEKDDISFLWSTELMGIEPYFKESDEAKAEELYRFFRSTIKRLPSGRYQISLLFKPTTKVFLGTNRKLTENRLKGFLAKARKDKGWLEAIDKEIQNLLDQGFIEETTTTPTSPDNQLITCHWLQ